MSCKLEETQLIPGTIFFLGGWLESHFYKFGRVVCFTLCLFMRKNAENEFHLGFGGESLLDLKKFTITKVCLCTHVLVFYIISKYTQSK